MSIRRHATRILWALLAVILALPATSMAAEAPAAAPTQTPMAFVEGVYDRLLKITHKSPKLDKLHKALHKALGDEMGSFMDYTEMGRRTLGKKRWPTIKDSQRKEFLELLEGMVRRTYVKRFKPGKKIRITYDPKVRISKSGRAQVRTTIHIKRSSADVNYSMHQVEGAWRVYDIIVDDASQVHVYRRSFGRILKREGWPGLIQRMKRSAGRK